MSGTQAFAQDYPQKAIRVVSTEAGGSGDFIARLILPIMADGLGQQLFVDNRPGATVTGELVAKANPDGYTILSIGTSFWLGPLLRKQPYDVVRDFAPVILMTNTPTLLTVPPSLPVNSVKELIALAKARPGQLNVATTAAGGAMQLAAELFKSMANVNIVSVPYKGTAQAVNDTIGGQVQIVFPPIDGVIQQVKAGRLKALAITTAEPSALFPGLPTVAASGLPGYEIGNKNGVFAPAKTPAPIIDRLNREVARALARPEIKEKLSNVGFETLGSTPEQFGAVIKSDIAKATKLIQQAGIHVE
jgi:tripartite-type tricarboxylate transporter receptor subunit TctC